MIVIEFKLKGKDKQFRIVDEMIRTAQFVRNKALRYWMDNSCVKLSDLYKQCAVLAHEFEWAGKLNSMARQASAERAIFAIQRFFANCKAKKSGKKGYPQFKKHTRSVEYKTSGWKLSKHKKCITFTDGFAAGSFRLVGSRDLHFYAPQEIKRVRVVRRADGYYAQFCVDVERTEEIVPSGRAIGLDVGLNHFYTDSTGATIPNPRNLRKSEKALKRAQRRVSKRKKGSKNRRKAINRLGKKHLKVSRQRKDFAIKTALCVVKSNDFVAHENLQVKNMVKNRHLAKSISDAAWSQFTSWLQYLGKVYGKVVVAVPPQYTSQNCSQCGEIVMRDFGMRDGGGKVSSRHSLGNLPLPAIASRREPPGLLGSAETLRKKTLSVRTHVCKCGFVLDRDYNAALNILARGLKQYPGALGNYNASGQTDLCFQDVSLGSKLTG